MEMLPILAFISSSGLHYTRVGFDWLLCRQHIQFPFNPYYLYGHCSGPSLKCKHETLISHSWMNKEDMLIQGLEHVWRPRQIFTLQTGRVSPSSEII